MIGKAPAHFNPQQHCFYLDENIAHKIKDEVKKQGYRFILMPYMDDKPIYFGEMPTIQKHETLN